jgi:small subunit ribosomal protein S8
VAYSEEALGKHPGLRIELKYFEGQPAIKHVARVSKPGRRVYSGSKELPSCATASASPSSRRRGRAFGRRSARQNVGGEVLAEVF